MALIIQLVFITSWISFSCADIAATLANYQKTAEGAFNAIQNDVNVQRQAYNQAIAKLSADINEQIDIKVRLAQDQVQNQCNRQLYELDHQLQELTNRTNSERARLQSELQAQSRNSVQRMDELVKSHQQDLDRVRSELSAANAQTLNNLRRELEGRVDVAQGEVVRIQTELGSTLQNVQRELELTRKDSETRFQNAHLEAEQQNRKFH